MVCEQCVFTHVKLVESVVLHTVLYVSCSYTCLQWNLSNPDTNGADESVIVSEVSSFQRLNAYKSGSLGWEKVSCLERCLQFSVVA